MQDRVAISKSKTRWWAELNNLRFDVGASELERLICAKVPVSRIVNNWAKLTNFMSANVVVDEVGALDGPAAMGNPVALRKVDVVKHSAPAAPVLSGSAETAQASGRQRAIGHPDDLAVGERLSFRVKIEAAAFEKCDFEWRVS